jgi:hypothetical protein
LGRAKISIFTRTSLAGKLEKEKGFTSYPSINRYPQEWKNYNFPVDDK